MDKFGIFKLLSSFFNFYKENANDNQAQNSASYDKGDSNCDSANNSNSSLPDGLKNLFANFGGKDNTSNANFHKPVSSSNKPKPIQNGMLTILNNHDNFVKKVKEKNKQV